MSFANTAGWNVNLGSGALSLGVGSGAATLGFDLGSLSNYDRVTTSALAQTANSIVLNFTRLSGFGAGAYDLLSAGGGLDGATYSVGTFDGTLAAGLTYGLAVSPTVVRLNVGASTGDFYWNGGFGLSWLGNSGLATNWSTNLAGTINANGTPGAASSVIFTSSNQSLTALPTTLDAPFSIRDLTFNSAVGSGPLASVSIAPGTGGTLTITPVSPTSGINVQTGAPTVIALSAPIILRRVADVDRRRRRNDSFIQRRHHRYRRFRERRRRHSHA
ncbi:MAG: hypothetical protein QM775_18000 [Pirellulales bacterium]